MDASLPVMTLRPIGTVRNGIPAPGAAAGGVTSEIVVESGLAPALDGLDGFSHIIVIYWMHRAAPGFPMKTHPRRQPELPLVGVLATRSPQRPNPLGLSVVKLLGRRDNVLSVEGLDALDGSPVIDIKPYIPSSDSIPGARTPAWTSTRKVSP